MGEKGVLLVKNRHKMHKSDKKMTKKVLFWGRRVHREKKVYQVIRKWLTR